VHAGGRLAFRLGGPLAGDDYDTLTVAGAVSLAGALDLEAAPGLPLASSFTLINSAGAGAVSGAFTNKPNNSAFTEDGYRWRITYAGGTGNDVVLALASLPTLSDLTNVTVAANTSAGPLAFTVGDAETAAEALTVTAASSNPALMPTNRIILGGAGANRTVTLSPASNQTGTATITLTVSDGLDTASDSFVLSVVAASVWTNAAAGAPLPWTQGANWLAGSPAFSHTNGALAFLPGQTLSPGALVATNDNPGTFQLATLRLAGDGPAGGAASVTLTGGPLALGNGAVAPALSLEAGAGAGGSLSYTVANALALARTVNITGDGSADFVLSGALQGAGGLAKSGAATLRLTGPNTFAGGLALADNAGVTAASLSLTQSGLGSGPVAIGAGATLQLDCSSTAAGTVSKTNAISGAGALQLSFSAGATPRATALPGLSGFAGEVQLTGAAGTGDKLDASGVLAPAAAVLVDSGHTLVVSNAPASFASLAVRGAGNAEGRGALRLASAAAALTAPLTLLADTTLAGDHPSATFAGPITGTAGTGATQTLAQGTAAAAAGCTISGALSDGPNGGRLALAQTRGTLTLAGASTYSGATTVSGGTLALGAHDALPVSGAVTLGTPAGAGALALGAFSQTLATLTIASTNSLLTNLVAGATGQALTLSGAGGLTVGTDSGTNSFTRCRMVGGGRLAVTNPAALVVVGKAQPTQNYANSGTLDLAGLSSVLLGAPDAPISELRVGYGLTATGWLALSDTSNSVAATTVQIGCSAGGNGGSSTLILGAGANVISANALSIGLSKSSGILKFASQAPSSPGTVTITGRTKPAADLTLGAKTGTGTAATPAGTLDLRGHAADVTAGALTIGKEDNNNTQYSGGATGALLFDGGAFTASNVVMAAKSAAGTGLATATLTVSGGVFTVVSGGALTLASQSGGGSASGTLNVLGGTFRTYADLRDGGGSATSTVNLNGGALDLSGRAVGAAAPRVDALLLRAGTLMNLGQFNGGEPLVKSGPGTLVLAGTNTYTGATVASNGVLRLAGPAVLPPAANLAILSGASVDLAYAGTQTVHTMTVNGTQKKEGVYGASRLAPYLTGTGFLRPLWPPSPRTLLLIW
jgi:autotransporter-associated beta strand protein